MSAENITIVDLPSLYRGDTWLGLPSVIIQSDGQPVDLTGAEAVMHLRKHPRSAAITKQWSTGEASIEIIAPASAGQLKVNPTDMNVDAADYHYSLQVELADGIKITILKGTWKIVENPTRNV